MPLYSDRTQAGVPVIPSFNSVTQGIDAARATTATISGALGSITSAGPGAKVDHIPNPLEKFASYNYLWTLACLTPEQYNDPTTYRTGGAASLTNVVFSSAGRFDESRVGTLFGKPEYFVDDVEIAYVASANQETGTTGAYNITFTVYEPYSMGLFYQSLVIAAKNAGYLSHAGKTPFVLALEFVGYDNKGQPYSTSIVRYIPICLTTSELTVTESGSKYAVTAVAMTDTNLATEATTIHKDLHLTGKTVKEILTEGPRSLTRVLSEHGGDLSEASKVGVPDVYLVVFPEQGAADVVPLFSGENSDGASVSTAGPGEDAAIINRKRSVDAAKNGQTTGGQSTSSFGENKIASSSMGFNINKGGNVTTSFEAEVYKDTVFAPVVDKNFVQIDPESRSFTFAQNQSILDIITEILLCSEYCTKAVTEAKLNSDGTVNWFKIDCQNKIGDLDPVRNTRATTYIYRIYPYPVHSSFFQIPSEATTGTSKLEEQCAKNYQFIYTGQNVDVLKFELKVNHLFFTGILPSPADQNAKVNNTSTERLQNQQVHYGTSVGDTTAGANSLNPVTRAEPTLVGRHGETTTVGGAGIEDTEISVARDFHNALLNANVDMVMMDIDVLGDPFYIVDAGTGNHFPAQVDTRVTEEGTLNTMSSDSFIYLTLRTPIDVLEKAGLYGFPNNGSISPLSGVYRIIKVENHFKGGVFTSSLNLARIRGQQVDFEEPVPDNPDPRYKKPIGVVDFGKDIFDFISGLF